MSDISRLEPRALWEQFARITQIPRPSKREERIIAFLEEFAAGRGLEHHRDTVGNVVIRRPTSPRLADRPAVTLQSHMDMVCEKNSGTAFDFAVDPIRARDDGHGWVRAEGTTLGADNGIGMATALALLGSADIELPAVEALFTVDEETGLTGAFNLGEGMITGKYLINLDSDDEGEIFIGCAGGIDTVGECEFTLSPAPAGHLFFRIDVAGLAGGHSGDDIDKGRANSVKLIARLLRHMTRDAGARLAHIDGGNLRNAIPREAHATLAVPRDKVKRLFEVYENVTHDITGEVGAREPRIDITISETDAPTGVMTPSAQTKLIDALQGLPNGIMAMSREVPGLVETSTNLASVKMERGTITITTSQRSSVDSSRFDTAASVRSVLELAGFRVRHSEGYPGWKPDPSSRLLTVAKESYKGLFGEEPKVRAIHAGLECGLFLVKYPDLEMISIGPTILGAHSPDERLEIASVDRFWRFLVAILRNI